MLLVHVERPSPRSTYAIRHVLERMLGQTPQWVHDAEEFRQATGPKLSYTALPIAGAMHIPWTGAIDALPASDPEVVMQDGLPALFPTEYGPDLFAGIFFLLSLVDEARCTERDPHGRVPSAALFSVRKGLADRPWVDEVVLRLGAELERRWPNELDCRLRYNSVVTVDMDNILRYAARPMHRALGASVKDLLRGSIAAVKERWQVRAGGRPDPYEKAIDLIEAQRANVSRAVLFFLMKGEGAHDHAAAVDHPATRALIQRAARTCEIGIHPSYDTVGDSELAAQERIKLQHVISKGVRFSRQHYLRWRVPETLRSQVGFNHPEDHTLGFSDRAGFRAATCTPFMWYDLEREEETKLQLWPFAAMDSALIERMGMGPTEVVRTMNAMSDAVRAVSGTFVSVWHDRYLSGHREFAPWPSVFEQVVQHARP